MLIINKEESRKEEGVKMRKIHRNMLMIAGGLIIAGAALGGAGLLMGAGSTEPVSYLTETVDSQNISIYSGYDDIVIESSDDESITITYPDNRELAMNTENGAAEYSFTNTAFDPAEWYKHLEISFNAEQPVITLRLPSDYSGEIKAQSTGADITVSGISAGSVSLESKNGNIISENSQCDIFAKSNTGDVSVSGGGRSAEAESEHGNVKLSDSEYEIVNTGSDSGSIEICSLVANAVYMNNGSGEITAKEVKSGSIDIINDYGDTALESASVSMLSAESSYGDIRLSLTGQAEDYSVNGSSDAANRVYVNSEYGDTNIEYIPE